VGGTVTGEGEESKELKDTTHAESWYDDVMHSAGRMFDRS